ncbi:MAG: Gfo/Idh/MocA family oxidoreductase, partial [Anaerolineales bacterium]|nr:Gfo/Idh/MocA family oxidoreductase [Anaerolineales bacterium]
MKIRWGIMSTANIGVKSVIPAMLSSELCTIKAIASRNLSRATKIADQFGIPKRYGSYDELLDDPNIDAVYIPLPNHLHVPWSIKAIQAGKHVLCEKPIGLNSDEAQQLVTVSAGRPGIKVMEAFMYRFHPQWQIVRQLIDSNKIGELRSIQTAFSYYNVDPTDVRNKSGIGGGALLDIGCYCISLARFVFQKEPRRVLGSVEFDPVFSVDRLTSGILEFE